MAGKASDLDSYRRSPSVAPGPRLEARTTASRATQELRAALQDEANAALVRGGLWTAFLWLVGGALSGASMLAGQASNIELPVVFTVVGAALALLMTLLARRRMMARPIGMVAAWLHVSTPTFLFLASYLWMPGRAATFLTGPFSYLYLPLIVMTGFLWNARVTITTSLVAAGGLLGCFALARPELERLGIPDPTLRQDLVTFQMWGLRALMFVFCAVIVVLLQRRFVLRFVQLRQERAGREHVYRLLGEYVSPEVREKVVNEKVGLSGEKKLVAVLFCDLRGFTRFSERSDPAVIVARLNEYFDAMVQCITRNGGVVDKFVGDAIMAVFGGVLPLESPCDAAVRAAREMRAELRVLETSWREQGIEPFDNGIGVHFGEVVQGNIGSHDRKDFTVIGDAVNTASRLEGLTKDYPHPIVISADVHARLSPSLQAACEPLGKAKVKGKAEQVDLFGVGPASAPVAAEGDAAGEKRIS